MSFSKFIGKVKAIRSSRLTANEKHVLQVLNSYADENGKCYPSIRAIIDDTSLSQASVFRVLSSLCANDIITRYENPKGKTNVYKIHYENLDVLTERTLSQREPSHSDSDNPLTMRVKPSHSDSRFSHSDSGALSQRECIYNEELTIEHANELTIEQEGKEKRKKETPCWEQKTFEEVLEEVKDRPYLERMAYAVKAHPMVRDLYKDSFITAIDSIGYDIMDDFKAEAERRERAGEPLNDWHRGVLSGDWRYKDIILGHYQHMQNAEKHLFGEPIDPEAYREFGHYYDRVFPKFEKQIKDLFLDLPVRKKDPQWKDYFNRHGDGPWTYRKYTRS